MTGEHGVDPIAIDVSRLARRSVHSLRSHLVTRPTGRAVRLAIESQLAGVEGAAVSLVDLSEVTVLDFSCADEVVAKLLIRYLAGDRPREAFFVFRGIGAPHRPPVEAVLERHALATVAQQPDGSFELLGAATPEECRAWGLLEERGRIPAGADAGGVDVPGLEALARRRLAFRSPGSGDFLALSVLVRDLL